MAAASFLTMPELVQTIGMGHKTGELTVTDGRCSGKLWFREGQIQRALCESTGKTGLDGAVCLLCMGGAATRFRPINVDRNPEGAIPTMAALLEAARRTDEGWRLCEHGHKAAAAAPPTRPAAAPVAATATAPPVSRSLMFEFEGKRRMDSLHRDVTAVGRDEACEICLPALSVSRRHAEIHLAGPILEVRDLNSRNGTFVNGAKTSRARIDRGDEVVFGDVRAFVVVADHFEAHRLTEAVLRPGHASPANSAKIVGGAQG